MRLAGDSWEDAQKMLAHIAALRSHSTPFLKDADLTAAIASIGTIRDIVRDCLSENDNWYEYYVALALCSLRAITWPLMSLGGRRMMFLISGLAVFELNRKSAHGPGGETPSPDETDMTDHLPNSVSWDAENGIVPPDARSATLQGQQAVQLDPPIEPSDEPIAPENLAFEAEEYPQETGASVQPIETDSKPGSDSS
jgi:hypothetical protein